MNKKVSKVALGAAFLVGATMMSGHQVHAAKGDQGTDNAVYQGYTYKKGYADDKFGISQIGGYIGGRGVYDQKTYQSQIATGIAQKLRMHTYIWWQGITTYAQADYALNYFLPKVQTPKGSIVALDVESGAQNTDVIMYALQKVKDAGYTPMLYGYKNYLVNNTDLHRIANNYPLWMAEYPNYQVTRHPNYNYFPSFDNIGMFQFTSTYIAGGLDGNVDLTGVTDNGYTKNNNPKTDTPAVEAGKTADKTPKRDIKVGDKVKVNFSAIRWPTGQGIPSFIKGNAYTVRQISGNNVLLSGVNSWINKRDVEILMTAASENKLDQADYVEFNNVYVLDRWFRYNTPNKWYVRNNDFSIPIADYNNDIPAKSVTLTDRYGRRLNNQLGQGNNGVMEYFIINGKHKVLQRAGQFIKLEIGGEPVWLKTKYVN